MDRSAADMTDGEARSLGHLLRDGLSGLNALQAARCLIVGAALASLLWSCELGVRDGIEGARTFLAEAHYFPFGRNSNRRTARCAEPDGCRCQATSCAGTIS